ncbi:hypothetical protein SCATT_p08050 (plasmid) [Streptantibioticus cattleyicolor NRRL 8057 = DSM 46488]|uniref:Uncharacterized protein n=1 Tax=Streptantibioticus cattleyicolor (strain ATCC 35852 / DSM 46488 / JCM 4925 / NBRC 14057 / NRRL 8057) TaxID=1003195 RepID=G8XD52_STREN|nr:hypothetical protein SCATT_p08050 [Streptantibioticus cattleyicolor NRRL 8057 = DSM 46488]
MSTEVARRDHGVEHLQVQVVGLGGRQALAVAVAPRRVLLTAFTRDGADSLGGLRFDALLQIARRAS